jgi:hypothetical protein
MHGINLISATLKRFIEAAYKRPDIILAVFHRMMMYCLGGESPPGFSGGMPAEASALFNFMVISPNVHASDITVYAHLSDIMLRIVPQQLKNRTSQPKSHNSHRRRPDASQIDHRMSASIGVSKPSFHKDASSNRAETCRNFNFHKAGCTVPSCRYAHRCASCGVSEHSNFSCSNPIESNNSIRRKKFLKDKNSSNAKDKGRGNK